VLLDQLGELGRVLALLDQLIDGLVRVTVGFMVAMTAMSAVRPVPVCIVLVLVIVAAAAAAASQGKNAVEGCSVDVLGYLVFDGGEETSCGGEGIPPRLDCILDGGLVVAVEVVEVVKEGNLLGSVLDRASKGSASCEQQDNLPHCAMFVDLYKVKRCFTW
jgi:hypothetical protein